MANMFNVEKIERANKENYVVVTVKYEGNPTEYTYVRKEYKEKGTQNKITIIQGKKIKFDTNFNFLGIEDAYETKGIKRLNKESNSVTPSVVESIKKEIRKTSFDKNKEIRHKEYDTIKSCIKANVPVYLEGPAGSGKNYTIKKIAEELDLDFYFTNSVQQEYKITGFIDAGGTYHETEFYKAFKDGGLFFLDEMDASIPEVLILLNAAIANGYFEFPNGKIDANENFRVIAAGNTYGKGANEQYTGRMVIDSATLDRFVMIHFDYDTNVELSIAKGDEDLVTFVHELRTNNENNGTNYVFSYRCIEYIVKLKNTGMNLENILKITVFKGMDIDEIRMYSFTNNEYANAVKNIAA